MKFTKDELYIIERDADSNAGIVSRNIHKLCEAMFHSNMIHYDNDKNRLKYGKIIMNQIQEQHRASEIYKQIRDKCEKERTGNRG